MTTFDDRERAFENMYAHDEEMKFKAEARRNKLVGLWAAALLGKSGDEANAYALDVVRADFEEIGHEDVVRKVMKDIKDRGAGISEDEVRAEMERLFPVALEQVKEGFKSDTV